MTNTQIIAEIAASIYGSEAVNRMIENGEEIPLHTLKGWEARGNFRIRKGEHGYETKLWKKRRKGKDDDTSDNQNTEDAGDFVLVKSYLFRFDQVEEAKD